ncbi:MAG: PspC domain-containing protein [Bacteroidetes bacterium]|jgi:phage shock protein PspC (stress-responsive transcriptional regulator)|nr:PspC domain-containing protein [Bacteroidota bacterium]
MKKTTTINLNNMVFHIDEDAFIKLKKYLQSVERKINNSGDAREIIEDVEARISELLSQKINDHKQVVNIKDIEEIISILGDANDFDESGNEQSTQSTYTFSKVSKRMYRDPDNRILGGVCGGMAAYFNTDPIWFRLLFVVLFLVGGSGILIYLILWIILPEAKTTAQKLEMRGEAVTIENIKRAVREEFENVKHKMKF